MSSDAQLRRRSGAVPLAVGSVVSGLLAYVFFALVTRGLGAAQAAPVAVLWAYWGFAAAGVTFPVQHWIARSVAADGDEASVRGGLARVAGLAVVATAASGGLAWVLREPLFGDTGAVFPLLVGAVTLLSALMGLVRGLLVARTRFGAVAGVLVLENLLRCVVAEVLLMSGVDAPAAYGGALLAGYAACLAWPSAWRPRGRAATSRPLVGFLSGAAGGQVVGQAVLTGGPVVLALAGGAPREVTALFAALALFRAPYTLAVGQVAALTARVTDLVVGERQAALWRLHRVVLAGTVAFAALAALVGALAGPAVLLLVFGADVALGAGATALVATGSAVAVGGLVLTVVVMAHDRAPRIALAWGVALLPGAAAYVLVDGDLDGVVAGFVVIEVAAWALLALAARPVRA